jgi:hypothetical protein
VFRRSFFARVKVKSAVKEGRREGGRRVKFRYSRLISGLVISAVASSLLPQVAYAAPASGDGDDGKGIVDTVKGWFSDEEDGEDGEDGEAKPPGNPSVGIGSREKLPKGKAAKKAKRVKELKSRRTFNARYWKLSDGRVQAEVSAVPTAYRAGKSWKDVDPTVTATDVKGFRVHQHH